VIVLDASALVDVIVDQPAKESVLAHLDQPIAAPAHQLAEMLSAVARLVRAGEITADDARKAIDDAYTLEQEHVAPDAAQLRRALELQQRIRVLDGLYVALAEQRQCALLTTDRRLANGDPPCEVILAHPAAGAGSTSS
jgi:predicted nucleic acid-binding protein